MSTLALAQAEAPATTALPHTGPDGELLALLAQFDDLERAYCAVPTNHDPCSPADKAADAERKLIASEQDKLVTRIGNLAPKTLPGAVALAQSLALWDAELFKSFSSTGQILTATLVEALVAMDPTSGPDAELIAAAAEFRRLHDVLDACDFEAEADAPREVAAIAGQTRVTDAIVAVAHRMAGTVATTHEGLAARAMAMGRADPHHHFDHEGEGGTSRVLLDALLRDGAALAGVPMPGPDAELLALRPEYERLRAEYDACNSPNVSDIESERVSVAFDTFCDAVAQMPPAVTAAGRALQAIATLDQLTYVADWESGETPSGAIGAVWQVLVGQVGDRHTLPRVGRAA